MRIILDHGNRFEGYKCPECDSMDLYSLEEEEDIVSGDNDKMYGGRILKRIFMRCNNCICTWLEIEGA